MHLLIDLLGVLVLVVVVVVLVFELATWAADLVRGLGE